jgi:hypothetical protein
VAAARRPRLYGYSDSKVKITPGNQSLILAGEPSGARGGTNSFLDQATRLVASGTELKRVTILAAHPNSTVVVQADYFSREEYAPVRCALPALPYVASHALQASSPNSSTADLYVGTTSPTPGSSYRNPAELYARTQRGLDTASKATLLDVLA